jgi:ParB family chromosome partitioning protein
MRELKRVPISSLLPDPDQPRKQFDETELLALGNNMKRIGQQVPAITWDKTILDGERRWRAAQLVGIAELDVIVLATRPTVTELRLLQMCIDAHRASLSPIERSDFLARIKQENNWSVQELAERLSMKQPLVTKLLKFRDGCEELRAALHAGQIDQDKAYTICQEPDHGRQCELLKRAGDLTREQMRQKARNNGDSVELKASVARFPLPTGILVTVQGRKMTLACAIDAMLETVKELKKGQSEHWDITTAMRVMRDRAHATN